MPEAPRPPRPVTDPDAPASSVDGGVDPTTESLPRAAPGPASPPPQPGDLGILGPYRVVKQIGRGGMGAVYLGVDTRLDRKVALKVMLPGLAANPAARERFVREARAAAKVTHDNVVTVYEADERDGVPFIAMQYLQGYTLNDFLRRKGKPSVSQTLRVARETAAGLAAAHALGLVHRDIKPANLWLEAPNGRVKVLDFGLAKAVDGEGQLTRNGVMLGTPAFMAPEQARGAKLDGRADLFSLGTVLYLLCTGRLAFEGPSTMAVLIALANHDPAPVLGLNPAVPESLAGLIHQLLEKNPDRRPQTADEVGRRLRAVAAELAAGPPGSGAGSQLHVVQLPAPARPLPADPQDNPFEGLDATAPVPPEPAAPAARSAPAAGAAPPGATRGGNSWGVWVAAGVAVLLAVAVVFGVVSSLKKKGTGPKVPDPEPPAWPARPEVQTPAGTDSDRSAAEYVLSLGGTVRVNAGDRLIRAKSELPAGRFTLTAVDLFGNKSIKDAGLEYLKNCKSLDTLSLSSTGVTDVGLAHLRDCTGLTFLSVEKTKTTRKFLEEFARAHPRCQILNDGDPIEPKK